MLLAASLVAVVAATAVVDERPQVARSASQAVCRILQNVGGQECEPSSAGDREIAVAATTDPTGAAQLKAFLSPVTMVQTPPDGTRCEQEFAGVQQRRCLDADGSSWVCTSSQADPTLLGLSCAAQAPPPATAPYPAQTTDCTLVHQGPFIRFRECVISGALYTCSRVDWAVAPILAPLMRWSCNYDPGATGPRACLNVGTQTTLCQIGAAYVTCLPYGADRQCAPPAAGSPLAVPEIASALMDGKITPDALMVSEDCEAVTAADPAAKATAAAKFGPVPQDDAQLLAELAAAMNMLDEFMLAATGYDPRIPAQREAYLGQMSNALVALQNQPAGSPYAGSERIFDAAAVGPDPAPAARTAGTTGTVPAPGPTRGLQPAQIGGGEPGARCRSTAVWSFIVLGGLAATYLPPALDASDNAKRNWAAVWAVSSAGAFYLRENYESRMREFNAGGGTLPMLTQARRAAAQLLTTAQAYLATFYTPAAPAPAAPIPQQIADVYPDLEGGLFDGTNPGAINQAGQNWQAGLNQQAAPGQPPVNLFTGGPR